MLNELAVAEGRDPKPIAILAVPADRAMLQALAEAGADAAVVRFESELEAAVPVQLEWLAQQILRGRRHAMSA